LAQLIYAGVDLSEVQTQTYSVEPVMDRAGVGLLWNKLTISVVSVVHSLWTATGKPPGGLVAGGNMGVPGDRMGVSLARLPEILRQPRQTLLYRVGDDLVVESPPRLPDGTQLPCDCANGPFTSGVKVLQVIGDESAIVSFTVQTYLSSCGTFCVSNQWGVHQSVDDSGFMTRVIRGRAVFRADFMNLYGLTADHFRPYLFVPADAPLRRVNIEVDFPEEDNGNVIDYAVTDKEVAYGLGANSWAIRTEGFATSGGHIDLPSAKAIVKSAGYVPTEIAGAFMTGGFSLWAQVPEVLNTIVPVGQASGIFRVFGRKGAPGQVLAGIALRMGSSRFGSQWLGGRAIIVGAYITTTVGSEDEPMVELRLEFHASHLLVKFIFDTTTIFDVMNWDIGIKSMDLGPLTPPPVIGTTDNSRGSYIKQIVMQALGGPCQVPEVPGLPDGYANANVSGLA
jgi:hypothetical protein